MTHLRSHANNEAFLLNFVRLDCLVILQDLARVDELLRLLLPSLLRADLLLHLPNGFAWFGVDGELLLL